MRVNTSKLRCDIRESSIIASNLSNLLEHYNSLSSKKLYLSPNPRAGGHYNKCTYITMTMKSTFCSFRRILLNLKLDGRTADMQLLLCNGTIRIKNVTADVYPVSIHLPLYFRYTWRKTDEVACTKRSWEIKRPLVFEVLVQASTPIKPSQLGSLFDATIQALSTWVIDTGNNHHAHGRVSEVWSASRRLVQGPHAHGRVRTSARQASQKRRTRLKEP